ncbi:MAG: DUF1501 domain-containing protein [Planctomycetota bacterium]|nr:MAG: DUF1501 domain-containing protein [Planctomycetota bacterium]
MVHPIALTRRHFLHDCSVGLGAIAASALLAEDVCADGSRSSLPRARPRAKSVIYLQMSGAPPQHDLFDPKPKLQELNGQLCPDSFIEGRRLPFIKGHPTLLGSPYPSVRVGRHGTRITTTMPYFKGIVDDVTLIRSMWTDQFNHSPADLFMFTGSPNTGAASMGSWITYGLGSVNANLPGFVVMVSGGSDPTGGKSLWSAGFLPSEYQGVRLRGQGDPVLYVSDPAGMTRDVRRRSLDALRRLNELEHAESGDPETKSRIEQYELAFRMQTSVPEVMDIAREPQDVIELYGARPGEASFANNCLLARRLVEQGVRYVQLYDWGWDMHGTGPDNDLVTGLPRKCKEVDRPIAALVLDLKRRGLLDETLVVWGGEFGRTSMNEKRDGSIYLGRDHHPDCFTIWLAGAGIAGGRVLGATDELGYTIESDPIGVHDLQATILALLGLDAATFRYPYLGLEQRLIGPADGPRVVTL